LKIGASPMLGNHESAGGVTKRIFGYGYALGGQLDTNFVVCSVGTIAAEGVVTVIPFTNTYLTATETYTNELTALVDTNWGWKVAVVVGTDRNMFGVGFYVVP